MQTYEELVARGLIAQVINEGEIKKMVDKGKVVFYIGLDPAADSLHVGRLMAFCLVKHLQTADSKPIALISGGTGMIGDPSRHSDMRTMMTPEIIQHNYDRSEKRMSRFIGFPEGKAMMMSDTEWLMGLNYVGFLREVEPHFSVNNTLQVEYYRQRMEKDLDFLEFDYIVMQSYDFCELFKRYGCNIQFGGDDQWSNMLGGTKLIRHKLGKDAHVVTTILLLNSEGKKMGKTQSGVAWLDPKKILPFDLYQYWKNAGDSDVLEYLRILTFPLLEQIDGMDQREGSRLNQAEEMLVFEPTKLVHDGEEAAKAQEDVRALFAVGANTENMPTFELSEEDFTDETIGILNILNKSGLTASRSEARGNVEQGGVFVDGNPVEDIKAILSKKQSAGDGVVAKHGKKNFKKIILR